MKIKQIMKVVSCAFALAGCMSLEERLVSTDATVKRAAEYELVSNAHRNGSLDACVAAVERVSDRDLLRTVALQAKSSYAQEGVAAVKKLTEQDDFKAIAVGARAEVVAVDAYMRISEEADLVKIAKQTKYNHIRRIAMSKVMNKESLLPIVRSFIKDTQLVDVFVGSCNEEQAVNILRRGDTDLKLKKGLIGRVKSAERRLEFVNDYEIGGMVIESVGEQDIATYLMKDAKIEECAISDWSARAKVLEKLASRIDDESLIVEIAIKNAHVRNFVIDKVKSKDARDKVLDALLAEWKEAKDKEADRCVGPILKMVKDEEQVQKLLKNLHNSLCMGVWHDLVDRITDAATADMVYDNLFVYDNGLGSNNYLSELLAKIANKISAEKRSVIVGRLQSEKNGESPWSICGLYLGMNALDGFVLASETKNDVEFSLAYDSEKKKTGLLREDISVREMYFSVKYLSKAINCEDAEVLYYVIHRYVMNKTGKAYGCDYAQNTDSETERVQYWVGFSQETKYIHWQTYSNSRLGVKIWFDSKRGVVKITQI